MKLAFFRETLGLSVPGSTTIARYQQPSNNLKEATKVKRVVRKITKLISKWSFEKTISTANSDELHALRASLNEAIRRIDVKVEILKGGKL